MIDIHSHIIFGVDDGPKTLEDSLELIDEAYSQGIRKIIATSHRRRGMFNTSEDKIKHNYTILNNEVKNKYKDLELYYGGELYFNLDILKKLENKEVPTLADSNYVLLEFSSNVMYKEIFNAVDSVTLLGLKPILAHIERYNCLEKNKKRVEELLHKGALMQINSSSVLKMKFFGDKHKVYKKRAKYFIENDLISFVATDMHNLDERKPHLKEAYEFISSKYGKELAENLFKINAKIILEN
ncbi:tyrosine protein phosphatase [Gemella sp. 19428wG2_WT2a]|nr:tyrosine protein phosphatase [Gemella sp. 19428wG2_WT2a]TFU60532.1 tyrosine protein phosphatase [Gemella sp. WT2a]